MSLREQPLHTERVRRTEGNLLQLQERPGTSSSPLSLDSPSSDHFLSHFSLDSYVECFDSVVTVLIDIVLVPFTILGTG